VNEAKDNTVLTENDFIAIIRYLIELSEGRGYNRRHRPPRNRGAFGRRADRQPVLRLVSRAWRD